MIARKAILAGAGTEAARGLGGAWGGADFTLLAGLLARLASRRPVFYLVSQPRTLRLAVGPLGSEDARMAAGFVQGLNREKSTDPASGWC